MKNISGVIIARNEQNLIIDAIKNISFCNEIIVVDNGSTDLTREVSEKEGAIVYEINSQDFSKIRDFGMQKANGDWVLYIDADERVDDKLREEILEENSDEISAYILSRKNYYLGRQWPYVEKMARLFKKSKFKGWKGTIHETPVFEGKTKLLIGSLLHFTHRDLASMVDKTLLWSTEEARLRFLANHPKMSWWRFPRVMISAFLNSYIKQRGFKAGTVGIIESFYQSFSSFITYAKLWEMQNKNKDKKL